MTALIISASLPDEFHAVASVLQLDAQLLGDYSVKAVNGRQLQESLGNVKKHTSWATQQISTLSLVQGKDYEILSDLPVPSGELGENSKNSPPPRPLLTYCFTIDAAKAIAMVSRSANGGQVRRYFLHMEKTAQEAYRGNLPALSSAPSVDQVAMQEFDFTVAYMSRALEIGWGKGYVQKLIGQVALDVDARHKTQVSRLIPAPTALPGQKEEVDLGKGEHMLRQVIGSKECNLEQFKDLFCLISTTPLNETLVALGYQKMLKSVNKRNISGFQALPGKEHYATQVPLSSGPFKGQFKVTAWILNSFSEAEKVKILQHLKANYDKSCFK